MSTLEMIIKITFFFVLQRNKLKIIVTVENTFSLYHSLIYFLVTNN